MACCKDFGLAHGFQGEGVFTRCPECGGYHRDTAPAFMGLVSEACAAVMPTARSIAREFAADHPDMTWAYDAQSALFSLNSPGQGRAVASYQHIGQWEEQTGAFRWVWDLDEAARPAYAQAADHARQVGQHNWLRALTAPTLYLGATEARQLTMVAAYLSDLPMVAILPDGAATTLIAMERPVRVN